MGESLCVVALISGGKDSLYSILHCLGAGHKVIALANLYPGSSKPQEGEARDTDDIDSFMYQTVGHQILPLYEEALGLPLYRRVISGTATQTHKDYATPLTSNELDDETEDLIPLLQTVRKQHPEVNAVSTGAILSTYQRTRVESVAIRLGLVPLSYLWQYPFLPPALGASDSMTGLLDDMASMGCEARLIKIATGGLDDDMLWSDICDPRTRKKLVTGMQRFVEGDIGALKAAVLGEGGEFETLALNGPPPLWKRRIEVSPASDPIIKGEGGTSSIRLGPARTIANNYTDVTGLPELRVPHLLDAQFETVQDACTAELGQLSSSIALSIPRPSAGASLSSFPPTVAESRRSIYISNLQYTLSISSSDLRDSIRSTISSVKSTKQNPWTTGSFSSIAFATLLVRSMSSFAAVNKVWTSLFSSKPNPPARVTISCGDLLCQRRFLYFFDYRQGPRTERDGLHVQSWSYWAPANIGPYSQSITVPITSEEKSPTQHAALVYIAGQIPLRPRTMTLHSGSFIESAILSLQHLWRIGTVQKVDWWLYGISFLARGHDVSETVKKAEAAYEIWKEIHLIYMQSLSSNDEDDDEDNQSLDAWDLKYATPSASFLVGKPMLTVSQHQIPNPNILSGQGWSKIPPFLQWK